MSASIFIVVVNFGVVFFSVTIMKLQYFAVVLSVCFIIYDFWLIYRLTCRAVEKRTKFPKHNPANRILLCQVLSIDEIPPRRKVIVAKCFRKINMVQGRSDGGYIGYKWQQYIMCATYQNLKQGIAYKNASCACHKKTTTSIIYLLHCDQFLKFFY